MKVYKRFHQGSIIFDTSPKINFKISDQVSLERDNNLRYTIINYQVSSSYSDLPSTICEVVTNQLIQVEGDLDLYNSYILNGLEFIRRDGRDCILSVLLDSKVTGIVYEENEKGCWIKVNPASPNLTTLKTVINDNSTFIYVKGETFNFANIIAFHLEGNETTRTFKDTIPFNQENEFLIDESYIIDGFIKECKKQFPMIRFYNLGAKHPNDGEETVFYTTQLAQDRSPRFSNHLMEHEEFGRFFHTTIPLSMTYQTNSVPLWINRRLEFLVGKFLSNIKTFPITINLPSPYYESTGLESVNTMTFNFATFWDRNSTRNDFGRQDATDNSGRRVNALEMLVDLIVIIYEKKEPLVPIEEVIDGIYWRSE